jgi:hypothetical protein
MPSPRTSAENLARWRRRAGMRSANEALAIKKCNVHHVYTARNPVKRQQGTGTPLNP